MRKRKKIAILFNEDLVNRKGMSNAILARISYLQKHLPQEFEIEPICISEYDDALARFLRHTPKMQKCDSITVDGIHIDNFWQKFMVINYIAMVKLRKGPFIDVTPRGILQKLKDYDLISAHSFPAGLIALKAFRSFNVPYCITWHGSDIHTAPSLSKYYRDNTETLISQAQYNFFVSNALRSTAKKRFNIGENNALLYNGAYKRFERLADDYRNQLKHKYNISDDYKVVAFVGNLFAIKNAQLLPDIFGQINKHYPGKVKFWIIGDGKLRSHIEEGISSLGMNDRVAFLGNQPYEKMPELMNCIDLLVLPSKNEGLPLVTVEAIQCGAMVIGSNVGGIPEAIGVDNVVDFGDDFVVRFADKCVKALNGNYKAFVNEELDWDRTALKEIEIYKSILLS